MTLLVQEKILDFKDVIKITDLRDIYVRLLAENGIDSPSYRTEKLKAKLQKHSSDVLSFWEPQKRNETEIVFIKTVSAG